MNEYLFSYGTLQKEKTQLELFGRLLKGSKDRLKGYKTSSIEIKDESFLSKAEEKYQKIAIPSIDNKDFIEGTVLEITTDELLLADTYEPVDYKRIKAVLESGKKSWIYTAKLPPPNAVT